ncbi:MAG: DUF1611 domain-containing protein [Rhizobiales bacterium]|nr:DUF1611 domain-containing protein [Hyphomicrobiales bacterium]
MNLERPYLLFLGDIQDHLSAKTAAGILQWRPDQCVGQMRLEGCKIDLGIKDMTAREAAASGARTLVIGVANAGGRLPDAWAAAIVSALEAGLDVANALHRRLASVPGLAEAAARHGRRLVEVREPDANLPIGNGKKRSGKRVLAVGTDCSVGKMYTTLAIEKEMRARGMAADFRATGQTGILIVGSGVPLDAVVADFIPGAIEAITPDAAADHWDVIEGQGSLFHPSFAGVTIGLIHGSQPDALVMCHEPTRPHMRGLPHYQLPDLATCIQRNEEAARLTNPGVRTVGLSINTSHIEKAAARDYLARLEDSFQLPAVDPIATGVGPLVDRLAAI